MLEPDDARDTFLAETRLGILTTLDEDGWPVSVPVWYEWDESQARVFTNATSPKVRRLERDNRASLLVVNNLGEPEFWVAIDGTVEVRSEGGSDLAKRLADRYWDMTDEEHRKTVEMWTENDAMLRVLELTPTRVRTYG